MSTGARTHQDHLRAATILWGDAGRYVVTEYARLNAAYFDGGLPPLPLVIGITPYGACIGHTRHKGTWAAGADDLPRITIASNLFRRGSAEVTDTVLHEMVHARLILDGRDPRHNGQPWSDEITRLSPLYLGIEIKARPVKPRRVDGNVIRRVEPGHLTQGELARWPRSVRRVSDPGAVIEVASA